MQLPLTGRNVYDNHLAKWNAFHNGRDISRADVTSFFTLLRPQYKSATLNSIRSSLKAGMRIAGVSGIQELFADVRLQHRRNRLKTKDLLSEDEVRLFIRSAPPKTAVVARFLFVSGVRISGALDIRTSDCRVQKDGMVRIPISSKGSEFETTITKNFYLEIKKTFGSEEFLFQSPHQRYTRQNWFAQFRKYGREILGRTNLSPHKFKHAMCSHLLLHGKTVSQVAQRTGNMPATISQFYDLNVLDNHDVRNLERVAG